MQHRKSPPSRLPELKLLTICKKDGGKRSKVDVNATSLERKEMRSHLGKPTIQTHGMETLEHVNVAVS